MVLNCPNKSHADPREKSGDDAVPCVTACKQRLDRVPVNTVAKREPIGHSTSQLRQMRRDRLRLWGGTFHRDDTRKLAQPADQHRTEPEVRGTRVVVDAEGKSALARDRGEVLIYLIIG
jgi:hypothetical protein